MKKLILFISAIALILSSCGEKNAFTITGKLANNDLDGKTVYLQSIADSWKDRVNTDTAVIENGTFVFKGIAEGDAALRFVVLSEPTNRMSRGAIVLLEPGQIELTFDSISTVKGTPANDSFQTFDSKMNAYNAELKSIYNKIKAESDETASEALEAEYDAKDEEQNAELYTYLKSNIQTQIGTYLFVSHQYSFSLDQLKELAPKVNAAFKESDKVKSLEKRILALDVTTEGKQFVDIKGLTPDGKDLALSDYAGKGNYVLVDFWASWCPPCRKDMPNLVEVYNKYKSKGFVIVGVSIDSDKAAWEQGIKDLNITWPQVSDLQGWKSELSEAYGVASIPHTVLLDKDGKIMAKGLHGKEVMAKLDELLK